MVFTPPSVSPVLGGQTPLVRGVRRGLRLFYYLLLFTFPRVARNGYLVKKQQTGVLLEFSPIQRHG